MTWLTSRAAASLQLAGQSRAWAQNLTDQHRQLLLPRGPFADFFHLVGRKLRAVHRAAAGREAFKLLGFGQPDDFLGERDEIVRPPNNRQRAFDAFERRGQRRAFGGRRAMLFLTTSSLMFFFRSSVRSLLVRMRIQADDVHQQRVAHAGQLAASNRASARSLTNLLMARQYVRFRFAVCIYGALDRANLRFPGSWRR